ncbi:MAG: hypothetical protein HKN16_11875 [Saprospiraceae bacterium]|nr:hypothetical protein [Saprospiraceae bacterium]
MNKTQIITILAAIGLFGLLFLGFDTKPQKQKDLEKSRSFNAELTSGQALLKNAKEGLSSSDLNEVSLLESQTNAENDSLKAEFLKELSGRWYELQRPDIAGYYAEQVAELENSEESWAISGTTFSLCLQRMQREDQVDFCKRRAISSFENAISLSPENMTHQVNLAMVFANNPPQEQPMKGIQMLLALNRKAPENVLVLKTLARFGMQTNQFEKALGRLQKAKAQAPEDKELDCLLAKAHQGLGNAAEAARFQSLCEK